MDCIEASSLLFTKNKTFATPPSPRRMRRRRCLDQGLGWSRSRIKSLNLFALVVRVFSVFDLIMFCMVVRDNLLLHLENITSDLLLHNGVTSSVTRLDKIIDTYP